MAISTLELSFPRPFLVKAYQKRYSSPIIEYCASYIAPSFALKHCALRTINDERLSKHCQLQIPNESETQSKEGKIVLELRKLSIGISNTEIRINLHDIRDQPFRGESPSDEGGNEDPITIDRINFALSYSCVSKIVKNRGGSVYRSEAWYMGQSGVVLPCMLNTSECVSEDREERLVLVFEGLILSCDTSPLTLKFTAVSADHAKTGSCEVSGSLPLSLSSHPLQQVTSGSSNLINSLLSVDSVQQASGVTNPFQANTVTCERFEPVLTMPDSRDGQLMTSKTGSSNAGTLESESDESYRSLVHIEEIIAKDFSPKGDSESNKTGEREESPDLLGKIIEETILKDSENSFKKILNVNPFGDSDGTVAIMESLEPVGSQPDKPVEDSNNMHMIMQQTSMEVSLDVQLGVENDSIYKNEKQPASGGAEADIREQQHFGELGQDHNNTGLITKSSKANKSKHGKIASFSPHDQNTDSVDFTKELETSQFEKDVEDRTVDTVELIDPETGLMTTVPIELEEDMVECVPESDYLNDDGNESGEDKSKNEGKGQVESNENSKENTVEEKMKETGGKSENSLSKDNTNTGEGMSRENMKESNDSSKTVERDDEDVSRKAVASKLAANDDVTDGDSSEKNRKDSKKNEEKSDSPKIKGKGSKTSKLRNEEIIVKVTVNKRGREHKTRKSRYEEKSDRDTPEKTGNQSQNNISRNEETDEETLKKGIRESNANKSRYENTDEDTPKKIRMEIETRNEESSKVTTQRKAGRDSNTRESRNEESTDKYTQKKRGSKVSEEGEIEIVDVNTAKKKDGRSSMEENTGEDAQRGKSKARGEENIDGHKPKRIGENMISQSCDGEITDEDTAKKEEESNSCKSKDEENATDTERKENNGKTKHEENTDEEKLNKKGKKKKVSKSRREENTATVKRKRNESFSDESFEKEKDVERDKSNDDTDNKEDKLRNEEENCGKSLNKDKESEDEETECRKTEEHSSDDFDLNSIIESIKRSLNEDTDQSSMNPQSSFKSPSDLPASGLLSGFPSVADSSSSIPVDSFDPEWNKWFPWVFHDDENKVMFCRICIMAKKTNIYTTGSNYFCTSPLFNHAQSEDHSDAVATVKQQSPVNDWRKNKEPITRNSEDSMFSKYWDDVNNKYSLKGEGPEWQEMLKQCREYLRSVKKNPFCFKYAWLKEYKWLVYDEVENKMYCKPCKKHQQPSVFERGTNKFQKKVINKHWRSKGHIEAMSLEDTGDENGYGRKVVELDGQSDVLFDQEIDGSDEPLQWNRITPVDGPSSSSSEYTPQKYTFNLFSNFHDSAFKWKSVLPNKVELHMLPVVVLQDVSLSPNVKSGVFDCKLLRNGKGGVEDFGPFKPDQRHGVFKPWMSSSGNLLKTFRDEDDVSFHQTTENADERMAEKETSETDMNSYQWRTSTKGDSLTAKRKSQGDGGDEEDDVDVSGRKKESSKKQKAVKDNKTVQPSVESDSEDEARDTVKKLDRKTQLSRKTGTVKETEKSSKLDSDSDVQDDMDKCSKKSENTKKSKPASDRSKGDDDSEGESDLDGSSEKPVSAQTFRTDRDKKRKFSSSCRVRQVDVNKYLDETNKKSKSSRSVSASESDSDSDSVEILDPYTGRSVSEQSRHDVSSRKSAAIEGWAECKNTDRVIGQAALQHLVKFLMHPVKEIKNPLTEEVDVSAWKPFVILKDIAQDAPVVHSRTTEIKDSKQSEVSESTTEHLTTDLLKTGSRKHTSSMDSSVFNTEDQHENLQRNNSTSEYGSDHAKNRDEEMPRHVMRKRSVSKDSESVAQKRTKLCDQHSGDGDAVADADTRRSSQRITSTPKPNSAQVLVLKKRASVECSGQVGVHPATSLKRKSSPRSSDSESDTDSVTCKKSKSTVGPKKVNQDKLLKQMHDIEIVTDTDDDTVEESNSSSANKSSRERSGNQGSVGDDWKSEKSVGKGRSARDRRSRRSASKEHGGCEGDTEENVDSAKSQCLDKVRSSRDSGTTYRPSDSASDTDNDRNSKDPNEKARSTEESKSTCDQKSESNGVDCRKKLKSSACSKKHTTDSDSESDRDSPGKSSDQSEPSLKHKPNRDETKGRNLPGSKADSENERDSLDIVETEGTSASVCDTKYVRHKITKDDWTSDSMDVIVSVEKIKLPLGPTYARDKNLDSEPSMKDSHKIRSSLLGPKFIRDRKLKSREVGLNNNSDSETMDSVDLIGESTTETSGKHPCKSTDMVELLDSLDLTDMMMCHVVLQRL